MTKQKLAAFSILCLAASQTLMLSGCSGSAHDRVMAELKQTRQSASIDTFEVGKPFALGACTAQAHEVRFSEGYPNKITVVTADCPTSTTTTEVIADKHLITSSSVAPKKMKP